VNSQVTRTMHQPVQPCAKSSGCPESCISKGRARDGSSSCPEFRILRRFRRWYLRSPLGFALPVAPPDVAAGCPAPWHLQALPAMDFRVAPNLASFDATSGEAPGCPSASVHPSRLSMSPESPRLSHLPALPAMDFRVAPNLASFSASVA